MWLGDPPQAFLAYPEGRNLPTWLTRIPEVQGSDRGHSGVAEPAGAEEEEQDEMDKDEEMEEKEEEEGEEEKEEEEKAPPGGANAGDGGEMVIDGCSLEAPHPHTGGAGHWGTFHGWDEHHEEEENEVEKDQSWGAWSPEGCRPSDSWAEGVLWSEQAESAVASAPREGASARTKATRPAPMRELRSPSPARRPRERDGCSSKGKSGDRSSGKGYGGKGMYCSGGSGCNGGKDKCGKGKGGEGKSKSKGRKDKGKGGEGSGNGARASKRPRAVL